jgi:glycosyltransferase involved in cell wall biosynthesis
MKVIVLGTAWPYRGGLATFNERLARQFAAEGNEVEIWTFTLQYPSFLFPGKTQYTSEPAPKDLVIRRELNSCNPFNWWQVGRALRKAAPDLLVCCYWMSFFAPMYACLSRMVRRNGKTRCVALVHNMIPHEPNILDRLFAPAFVRSQDGFVALSESVVKDIERIERPTNNDQRPKTFSPHPIYDHYGERMSKTEACKALGLPEGKDYMLFFGLVRAYKGLDLLLEAFGSIKEQLPDLQLIVAGEFYEDEDKYRAQISALGLDERVVIRNEFIPDGDLRKYFSAASLVVQPYKTATQSGVTQVAFHFEKPMLVTNVGGLGEIVHDRKMGYACEPTPQSIAEAILDYYRNNRQEAYTAYLQKEKNKYAWSNMTTAFENILSQC